MRREHPSQSQDMHEQVEPHGGENHLIKDISLPDPLKSKSVPCLSQSAQTRTAITIEIVTLGCQAGAATHSIHSLSRQLMNGLNNHFWQPAKTGSTVSTCQTCNRLAYTRPQWTIPVWQANSVAPQFCRDTNLWLSSGVFLSLSCIAFLHLSCTLLASHANTVLDQGWLHWMIHPFSPSDTNKAPCT